jgi:hypothetical protein
MSDTDDPDHLLAGIPPARIANWERHGVDAIEADLNSTDGLRYVGGPPGTKEQARRWVRYKRAQQQEVLSLKPSVYGFSADLKVAWRKLCDWWRHT